MRVVGQPVHNVDASDKVTGAARYAVDLAWPGVLHGAVIRSQRAHALVTSIDAEQALHLPGVKAIVTFEDLDGLFPFFGHRQPDHPVLAPGRVRYWGEPVAVIVAETLQAAQDASEEVYVEYEDLEELMDVDAARAPGAPELHPERPPAGAPYGADCISGPTGTNEGFTAALGWGDVDAAMAAAAHVVRTRVDYPMLFGYPMEPYCSQARFVDGSLEVESNAQHPFQVQRDLARMFALELNRVRVSVPLLGGGYGAKSYTKLEPLAACCAWVVGEPVRIALDVEESMYTTRTDGAQVSVVSGFDADGRILAREIEVVLDTGAYADNSPRVLYKSVETCFGPYRVPALRVNAVGVFTNTTPASSYRGFGAYHTNAASESNLDQAAAIIGIDGMEIRLRNLIGRGEQLIPGTKPVDADLAEDLRILRRSLGAEVPPGRLVGYGFGCSLSPEGADPTSVAIVRLLADGTAVLMVGSTEMGQGARTVLSQMVAEELGLTLERVTVAPSDTLLSPYQWTTGASRTTAVVGLSVQRACIDARNQLLAMAAELGPGAAEDWTWENDHVHGPQGRTRTPTEVMTEWFGGAGIGEIVGTGRTQRRKDLHLSPALWEVGMAGVVISIDPDTGQITLEQLVTLADVGKAINPANVRGQDLGAATQGIGGALYEEIIYDGPQIVNANLVEYRVPRITDLATQVVSHIIEREDGPGPYGSKPVGEGALTVMGGAFAAAVANATGRWPQALPLTPERVWRLLQPEADAG
jgi:CO/xanthine dehydrogenase Mo-binding subunit